MVEKELLGVEKRPQDVLIGGLGILLLLDVGEQGIHLLPGWFAR